MIFHVADEVGVRERDGHLVHGTVCEITGCVWIKVDNQILDIPFDPTDTRLQPWAEVA